MKKKVLITGGAGFIGSALARNLLKKDLDIRLFDLDFSNLESFQANQEIISKTEMVRGSILDTNALGNAVRGCDYVIHLAAMLGVRRTETKRMECLNINILGTINVLEACLKEKIKKVLFTSSSEVYGETNGLPILEDSPKNPISVYAITKLAGEEYLKAYANRYGLNYSVVRFFNVYGPGQVAEFVMPRFIKNVLEGSAPTIYGDGSQIRAFCYVEDAAEGATKALLSSEADQQAFNIGNNKEPIAMRDLAIKVLAVSGKKIEPKYIPMSDSDRNSSREIIRRVPSIDKARKILKYEPTVLLDEGISKVMAADHIIKTWFEG
ncbi:NAD-dependent epimerase/dehydratase family protein [Candidatus Saganbacteria bacterium]|nr:NAD-dependent epimerase/dehydratase family protein [Candidatus Saganbacteria bacterium]